MVSKQLSLEQDLVIDIQAINLKADHFFILNAAGNMVYVVSDNANGRIAFFDKTGKFSKEVETGSKILQIGKFNNNLVVLTEKEMFYMAVGRYGNRTNCVMPQGSVDYFLLEESNYRFVYAVKDGYIYQYDLGDRCRPVRSYHIPVNSTLLLTAQLVFIESRGIYLALNLTDGRISPITLPIEGCQSRTKQVIARKVGNQYIFSRICLTDKILLSHILIDFENDASEVTDFSKFRIPLLLFSFGVIIYVTVKNKRREDDLEKEEKVFKKVLMG
jgi:hypothetical protein